MRDRSLAVAAILFLAATPALPQDGPVSFLVGDGFVRTWQVAASSTGIPDDGRGRPQIDFRSADTTFFGDMYDQACRDLANETRCSVVAHFYVPGCVGGPVLDLAEDRFALRVTQLYHSICRSAELRGTGALIELLPRVEGLRVVGETVELLFDGDPAVTLEPVGNN